MNIIVCVKYALDVDELKIDSETGILITSGVPHKVSDTDKNAVEEAVRLKEKHGGNVVAITFGPVEAKEGFKEILAMGVDEAYIVEDPFGGQIDTLATSIILAAMVRKLEKFDLIICGEATIDSLTYQIGPRLGERLKIPQLMYIRKASVNGNKVEVERDFEECCEVVRTEMPALLSVTRGINEPRIPSLMAMLKAAKKKVECWKIEDLGLSSDELKNMSAIQQLSVHPIAMKRKSMIIKDKPVQEAAEELTKLLAKEKVIGERPI